MKRVGFLYEQMQTVENCIFAERRMAANKPDNRMACHIGRNAEHYGGLLSKKLSTGTYQFHESRASIIHDSYKGKTRELLIPCLEDQAAEQAWMNIAVPYIMRRNYFYNCGSIPEAGQTRATEAIRRWLRKTNYKYGDTTDIRKFYEHLPNWVILAGLRRIFKDERFIGFAAMMLESMSPTGVGLAIGHPVSHWFANVALLQLDHEIKRRFPDVKYVRYMDDMAFLCNNKRHLNRAIEFVSNYLNMRGMELKIVRRWSLRKCPMQFLSYRFSFRKTVLVKRLMYRIARRLKRAKDHLSLHAAACAISYDGILKHCDSHNFKVKHVYPYVNLKYCRRLISNAAKNAIRNAA